MDNQLYHTLSFKQKLGIMMVLIPASGIIHAESVYQVTQPSGQVSVTDNIDTAYKLSDGNTQNIKLLDNLPSQQTPTITPSFPSAESKGAVIKAETDSVTQNNEPLPVQNKPVPAISNAQPLTATTTKISQKGAYRLQLITPTHDMVYHRPAQKVKIDVQVSPNLQQGDSIAYMIDGNKIAQTQDLSLSIDNEEIPLDKHTLQVAILNVLNQPIATAQADFYVVQNTIATQKRHQLEKLKAQLEAYDDLPWYQKLAVRLGIQKK